MKENRKLLLEQLSPEEAAMIGEARERLRSDPARIRREQLYKRIDDGTATPEELMEYEERVRRVRDLVGGEDGRKAYIDEC